MAARRGVAGTTSRPRSSITSVSPPTSRTGSAVASRRVAPRRSVATASGGNDGAIGDRDWRPVGVIEYGYAAPDPRNPDIVYGAGRNEVSRFQWSTGQIQNVTPIPLREGHRVERTQPIVFSPTRPGVMYYAAESIFESGNGGQSWRVISPDLGHPNPGVPPSVGALATGNA